MGRQCHCWLRWGNCSAGRTGRCRGVLFAAGNFVPVASSVAFGALLVLLSAARPQKRPRRMQQRVNAASGAALAQRFRQTQFWLCSRNDCNVSRLPSKCNERISLGGFRICGGLGSIDRLIKPGQMQRQSSSPSGRARAFLSLLCYSVISPCQFTPRRGDDFGFLSRGAGSAGFLSRVRLRRLTRPSLFRIPEFNFEFSESS